MKQYHDYLKYILENGIKKDDRTGTGTISIFGYQMRFDLSKGFPLVTTKKLHFKSIAYELLWFLSGDTNIKFLNDNVVKIWDEWAIKETKLYDIWGFGSTTKISESIKKTTKTNDSLEEIENYIKNHSYKEAREHYNFYIPYDENSDDSYIIQEIGEIGGMYGKQWTKWEYLESHSRTYLKKSINQISNVIEQIKNNPDSRRLIVSAWNVADLPDESLTPQENVKQGKMALAPCHYSFQFYVANNKLSCMFQMRSVDSFLGLPFNIASYALLTHMIAQQCGLDVGDLIFTGGDCHIYLNHLEQVNLQLSRESLTLPTLNINRKPDSIFNYKYEDFEIVNYKAYPHIKGVVAV